MKIKFLLVASLCSVNSDANIFSKISNLCYGYPTVSLGLAHIFSASAILHLDNDPHGPLKAGFEEAAALALCGFASQSKKQFLLSTFMMWLLTGCIARQIARRKSIPLNDLPSDSPNSPIFDNNNDNSAQPWQKLANDEINNRKDQIRSIAQTLKLPVNENFEPDQNVINTINRTIQKLNTEKDKKGESLTQIAQELGINSVHKKDILSAIQQLKDSNKKSSDDARRATNLYKDSGVAQINQNAEYQEKIAKIESLLDQGTKESKNLQNQVEQTKKENEQLTKNLDEQTAKAQQLEAQIQEKEQQIQELITKEKQMRNTIEKVQTGNTDLQGRVDALTAEIKSIDNTPLRENYEEALSEINKQKQQLDKLQQCNKQIEEENKQLRQDNQTQDQVLQEQKQVIDREISQLKEDLVTAQQKGEELLQINERLHQQIENAKEALKSIVKNSLKTIAAMNSGSVVMPTNNQKKFINQYTNMLSNANAAGKISEIGVREALKYNTGFGNFRSKNAFGCSDYFAFVNGLPDSVISLLQTVVNSLQKLAALI